MIFKKPWSNRTLIYDDLKSNEITKDYNLPDEKIRTLNVNISWASGASD